jgi:SAM-dependent methyltransferase
MLGWKTIKDPEKFFNKLEKKYGDKVKTFFQLSGEHNSFSNQQKVYDYKNHSIGFSLAISNFFLEPILESVTSIIESKKGEGINTILDLGCESGITSCYYAKLYPNAEITAIDINENCIIRANELKTRLGIKNVKFINSDLLSFDDSNKYDLILCHNFLMEASGMEKDYKNVKELLKKDYIPDAGLSGVIKKILTLLNENGVLFTVERLPQFNDYVNFINTLQTSSLYIDLLNSNNFEFQVTELQVTELDDSEKMPMMYFMKEGEKVDPFNAGLKIWLNNQVDTLDDLIHKIIHSSNSPSPTIEDLNFELIDDKTCIVEMKGEYQDGAEYIRIWKTKILSIIVHETTNGHLKTFYQPLLSKDDINMIVDSYEEAHADSGYCNVTVNWEGS